MRSLRPLEPSTRASTGLRRYRYGLVVGAAVLLGGGAYGARYYLARRAHAERARAAYLSYEDDETRAIEPNVAVNASDEVVVAWMRIPARHDGADGGEASEAADAIGVRFGQQGSASFATIARVVSPGGRFAADPAIAVLPDGAFVLTWLAFRVNVGAHGDAYDMRVYAARAEAGSGRFGGPVLVTTGESDHEYDRPWSAVTSRGRVVIGYRAAFRGKAGVAVGWSDDGGKTFGTRDLFADFGFGGGLVTACAAARSNNVYIAYFDPVVGAVVRVSHDGGDSFPDDAAHTVSAPGENVALEAPSCVADGEEVVVSYGIGAGPFDTASSAVLSHVALARSRDGGRAFDARASVSEPGRLLIHPRLATIGAAQLAIVAYALPAGALAAASPDSRAGELRFFRVGFGTIADGAVLRGNIRVAPRRDDPAWAGDYLGFVTRGPRAFVAYADVADGVPQVAFFTSTP